MTEPTAWPADDTEYTDDTLKEVTQESGGGWAISFENGWGFLGVSKDSPVVPVPGMAVRLYGKGVGYAVRGLFIDGQEVYYRSAADEQTYRDNEAYGATTAEMLERWDAGKGIWSITMGGISPGYEQTIQIIGMEMIRVLLRDGTDISAWGDQNARPQFDYMLAELKPVLDRLGPSGAQCSAAFNLATVFVKNGPVAAIKMADADRRQQQCRRFPTLDEVFTQAETRIVAALFSVFMDSDEEVASLAEASGESTEAVEALIARLNPPAAEEQA